MKKKIRIIEIDKNPNYYKKVNMPRIHFIEKSYLVGNTLILGKYKDKQRKKLSFHHEKGHFMLRKSYYEKLEVEIDAWIYAINQIPSKSISTQNVIYILKCLDSYIPAKLP